jgi:hypothetical protein
VKNTTHRFSTYCGYIWSGPKRARNGLSRFIARHSMLTMNLLVILLWGLVVLSRYRYNGTVFGFDYGLYQPDGAHYTFRTLTFLSEENISAAKRVASWYELFGINHNHFSFERLVPETNPVWNLSAPRVVYPILSMPFVYLFGIPGMLVLPAISLLVFCMVVMRIGLKADKALLALLAITAFLCSTSISRWMVSNITDGLLVMFCSLFLLMIKSKSQSWVWFLTMVLIVILSSLTRFCFPIWFFIGIYLLHINQVQRAIAVTVSSFVGLVPLLFYSPLDGVTGVKSNSSIFNQLLDFVANSFKVFFYEAGQLFVLDRTLFILLALCFACVVKFPRSNDVLLCSYVFLGCVVIGSINGVVGVNFRYYLPVLPFVANLLVLADWKAFSIGNNSKAESISEK